jgi:hypothetical protein
MVELPKTLEEAIAQSREATKAAIADGYSRVLVELVFPELKAMPVVQQFLPTFEEQSSQLKVFFTDAGAAALARRDWGEVPFKIEDLGNNKAAIERKIQSEDQIFLLVEPSAVEIAQVEQLCQLAASRPVVLLVPRLEDAATIGIGYAARQLRDRFLSTLESCYYIRPLDGAAVFRCYPSPWQVWLEVGEDYQLIAEESQKPVGDALDQILAKATNPTTNTSTENTAKPKKPGLMTNMQRFLRALSR